MVTPYLRPMNDPPFGALGEVLEFIDQTLTVRCLPLNVMSLISPPPEGLIFLHEHSIAHR